MNQICLDIISKNYSLREALSTIEKTLSTQRLTKEDRGDLGELAVLYTLLALQQQFNGLVKVYHSVLLRKPNSDWTTEIDFILVTPFAVFVIETKSYYGHTTILPNHKLSVKNQYGTKTYDVVYQNQGHCRTLYQTIYPFVKGATVVRPLITLFSVGSLTDSRPVNLRNEYPVFNVQYLYTYISKILCNALTQNLQPTVNFPKCIERINSCNIQSEDEMSAHIQRIQSRYRIGGHL